MHIRAQQSSFKWSATDNGHFSHSKSPIAALARLIRIGISVQARISVQWGRVKIIGLSYHRIVEQLNNRSQTKIGLKSEGDRLIDELRIESKCGYMSRRQTNIQGGSSQVSTFFSLKPLLTRITTWYAIRPVLES